MRPQVLPTKSPRHRNYHHLPWLDRLHQNLHRLRLPQFHLRPPNLHLLGYTHRGQSTLQLSLRWLDLEPEPKTRAVRGPQLDLNFNLTTLYHCSSPPPDSNMIMRSPSRSIIGRQCISYLYTVHDTKCSYACPNPFMRSAQGMIADALLVCHLYTRNLNAALCPSPIDTTFNCSLSP